MTTADIDQSEKGGRGNPGGAGARPLSTRVARAPSLARLKAWAAEEARLQTERWFLWSPAAFGGGCAIYFVLPLEPKLWFGALLAVVSLALALATRRFSRMRGAVAAANLVAFGLCGFFAAEVRAFEVGAPVVWQRTAATVEGWVVDVAGPGSGGKGRLLIAPYRISGLQPSELPAEARISVSPGSIIGPGEAVRLRAVIGPPPEPASPGAYDFARDSYFQRVGAVGFSLSEPMIVEGPEPPWPLSLQLQVNQMRWSLARRMIDDMGPAEGGVAVAMTTGHEAWLTQDEVASMRDSGLAHILSISGVHMAIVGGFVFLVFRTLIAAWPWLAVRVNGKKLAAAVALLATGVYLIVSGAPPPAVRSAVTLAVAFTAILVDRRAISMHALALAALICLTLQPEAVIQPGFQMSFAATAALIALAEVWPRPPKAINTPWPIRVTQDAGAWVLAAIAVSVAASLATDPIAIQNFNRVALYGVPSNLLMEPLSTFLIMPFLAAGALLDCFGLGGWALAVAGFGIKLLNLIAKGVAAWPHAVWIVPSAPEIALPISFLGILWLCLWRGRLRLLGLPAALAVLVWPRPPAPVAWIASDAGGAAVVSRGVAASLRPEAKQFGYDLWARRRGLKQPANPDAVMKAHFDCSRRRCLPKADDPMRLAAWWTRRAPSAEDMDQLCRDADFVILRGDRAPPGCTARVLTGADFARGGSVEIYRAGAGWRLEWANPHRGQRPWTAGAR
ncbi:MAG TPA: ComEC/Rec2 family competence protein [Caulobacteraceae bacterium]